MTKGLELVSLHIPKTAGTSFEKTLIKEYGRQSFARLDIAPRGIFLDGNAFDQKHLPEKLRVIHGHFSLENLFETFKETKNVKIITWLRDPVSRVISNYYYLKERLLANMKNPDEGNNVFNRMTVSLEEFAARRNNQNRMYKFTKGLAMDQVYFIGILEDFDNELEILGNRLGWGSTKTFHVNRTGLERPQLNSEDRAMIESYNQKDMSLYREAVSIAKNQGRLIHSNL